MPSRTLDLGFVWAPTAVLVNSSSDKGASCEMKTPQRRTIWFVRHGERIDNIDSNWKKTAKRWDDPFLSERGHQQAREVGLRLAEEKIDYVFTSPFTRCLQTTAGILSARDGSSAPTVFLEPGFGESLNACADPPGRPSAEETADILAVDEGHDPVFMKLPAEDGTDAGCAGRIGATLREIIARYPRENILIVSHGSPIAACHLELKKSWRYVGQCTIGKIIQEGVDFRCEFYGCKNHLSDKENLRDTQTPEKSPNHLPHFRGSY